MIAIVWDSGLNGNDRSTISRYSKQSNLYSIRLRAYRNDSDQKNTTTFSSVNIKNFNAAAFTVLHEPIMKAYKNHPVI